MLQLQVIAFTIIGLSQVALGQFDVTRPCSESATQIREGDMTFLVSQNGVLHGDRSKRGLISIEQHLWPNAIVPYTFGSGISENNKRLIWKAMRHWEDNTCLRFRHRTTEKDYINYYSDSDDDCCSYVGRQGYGQQGVSLGRDCMQFHTVVHQIGHVIGFLHEQTRPDRDRYIRVLYKNIQSDVRAQYDINNNINSRGVGYDYNSIMHYNDDAGVRSRSHSGSQSGRRLKTMESIPSGIVLGRAVQLSPLDILQTNKLYECDRITPGPPLVPQVIDPPITLPFPDCGQILTARNGVITSPGYPTYQRNQRCGWIIALGKGYRLRITIRVSIEQSVDCTRDYIEVLDGKLLTSQSIDSRLCRSDETYTLNASRGDAFILYVTDRFFDFGIDSGFRGFRLTYTSEDIDECARGFCSHGCQNLIGSFKCTCRAGFRLSADGTTCFDIQECAIDNGGCDHTCTNAAGSYSCSCHSGYALQPDGKSCHPTAIGTCEINNGGCQHTCQNAPGSRVICSCRAGYSLNTDQRSCSDINECTTSPGCSHACVNTLGSFRCTCPRGHQLGSNQRTCEDINECRDNTANRCSHGCQNTVGSFQCTCASRYRLLADRRTCVPSVLRQTLTSPIGTVALPANPSANFSDYIWIIRLPDVSKAVKLTFQSRFDIQDSPSCASSYLEIRDGDKPASMLVGRYCGSTAPPVITSSTNTLYIRLHTSLNYTSNVEFRAAFISVQLAQDKFVCGGVVFAPSQFGSADFSTIYNGEPRVCTILIGSTNFRSMDFRVIYTDLSGNCSQAKIEVFDGVGATAKKKATICSAEDARNATVRVNDFLMTVRYEVNIPGLRGFRASVTDTCDPGMIPPRSGTQCVCKQTV